MDTGESSGTRGGAAENAAAGLIRAPAGGARNAENEAPV